MDLRQIKHIIKEFEESNIGKLEITDKDFSIKLERQQGTITSNFPSFPDTVADRSLTATQGIEENVIEEEQYVQVKAPLVGTFYESPSPDAKPFVEVNQRIQKGDTLFIVEAMKVMNEVTAPVSGTIISIKVSDATMVEYGQVVMEIKE